MRLQRLLGMPIFSSELPASSGLNDPVLGDDAAGQMNDERDSFSERDLLKVQKGAFSAVE